MTKEENKFSTWCRLQNIKCTRIEESKKSLESRCDFEIEINNQKILIEIKSITSRREQDKKIKQDISNSKNKCVSWWAENQKFLFDNAKKANKQFKDTQRDLNKDYPTIIVFYDTSVSACLDMDDITTFGEKFFQKNRYTIISGIALIKNNRINIYRNKYAKYSL